MYDTLPKLRTATSLVVDDSTVSKDYKSGAKFHGEITDYKKSGHGTFIWPNGAKYVGDYKDNVRCGEGTQYWPDGSEYSGEFVGDLRHGRGSHKWSNGETYSGDFYRDRRHGLGRYTWPDGRVYEGPFYVEKKQGYGQFNFPDGRVFQGLYKDDEREGPGVVTYPDSRQDVGLWRRERLVKLCTEIDACFSLSNHPEFDGEGYRVTLADSGEEERPKSRAKSPFDYDEVPGDFTFSREASSLQSESLDARSAALDHDDFGTKFFEGLTKTREATTELFAWNNTASLIRMQKHILCHQPYEITSFPIEKVTKGDRSGFGKKGPLEELSEELIIAAMNDDLDRVEIILNEGRVHADVTDRKGRTALLGAALSWNQSIINSLLDHGADVNQVSDEGVSALAACNIFFYPTSRFKQNTALKREPTLVKEETKISQRDSSKDGYDDSSHNNTARANPQLPQTQDNPSPPSSHPVDNLQALDERRTEIDQESEEDFEISSTPRDLQSAASDFASNASLRNYTINVSEQLMDRCATQLSQIIMINERSGHVGSRQVDAMLDGTVRNMAVMKFDGKPQKETRFEDSVEHVDTGLVLMEDTIRLLLKRGANPNASRVPMPCLFFALMAADVEMVKLLLIKRASTRMQVSDKHGGLCPLHIAVGLPGDEGVQITELLLNSLADPDARANPDDSYISKAISEEIWSRDQISDYSRSLLGGRAPLHIVCARDDDYKRACKIVHMLLDHHASPNLLCNGHSPLSLAIVSGNDLAIEELLRYSADPSLVLTHGAGSALCVASSTEHECRRTIEGRIKLIDKLIRAGANILAPIPIGVKRTLGTVVDYAYFMFNLDRRIAHMPYHALSPAERDTFNDRRQLLVYLGNLLREKVIERERQRLEEEDRLGQRSRPPSSHFIFTGAGAQPPLGPRGKSGVSFGPTTGMRPDSANDITRRPLFKYCYECGRMVNVRLTACTRCKEVYYCSKACKLKAWTLRHKDECVRFGETLEDSEDRSPSPGEKRKTLSRRVDSPTRATDMRSKLTANVTNLMADGRKNPMRGRSKRPENRSGVSSGVSKGGPKARGSELSETDYLDNYSFI